MKKNKLDLKISKNIKFCRIRTQFDLNMTQKFLFKNTFILMKRLTRRDVLEQRFQQCSKNMTPTKLLSGTIAEIGNL